MSLATELLDNVTWFNEPIQISSDKSLVVPNSVKHIAVQYDHDVNTVKFEFTRWWGEIDLSTMDIYVSCVLPNGNTSMFQCTNLTAEDDLVTFDWVITEDVTWLHGSLTILVCAKATDDNGDVTSRWHSKQDNNLYISEGVACVGLDVDENPGVDGSITTTAILGEAVLGYMVLGRETDESLPKLGTPYVWLESGEKLDAPEIWLDVSTIAKLDTPTIELVTDKLDTPVIELAVSD